MTREEKYLLLKDLCARLIYGVKIQTWYGEIITSDINIFPISINEIDIEQLSGMKPYLRSMSSMTEEEKVEYCNLQDKFLLSSQYPVTDAYELFDWLNEYMFDYRGLILMGLALEAPNDMYNIKTE